MTRPPAAPGATTLARERAAAGRGVLGVLWRFSRPHTIIGTSLSVVSLYVIAVTAYAGGDLAASPMHLALTLLAGWCVNVFIVGINQIEDVEIDRINKPWLPIAAGELTRQGAWWIVGACAAVPLAMAVTQGAAELIAVALGLAIGTAYSVPPLRIKRYPALASLSITFVRAVVVNVGVWLHFSQTLGGVSELHPGVWALIAVTVPFGFAIAILKDVPDIEGDRRYAIATFSVRLGAGRVLALGVAALTVAEAGMAILGPLLLDGANGPLLAGAHLLALAALWVWAARVDPGDREAVTVFYQRVWKLFFLEYVIVAAAYLLG
jgi:homogentisate phytyltransferase / homogentisate geranylgeranyltransferase